MKRILPALIFLFCSFYVISNPISIKGKIVDEKTGYPVEYACVFIANTTIGAYSDKKGEFRLTSPTKGVLNLIVTHVSYQTLSTNITANKDSLDLLLKLKVRVYELHSVGISKKDPIRYQKLEIFFAGLLGQSGNALRCKISNPSILHFNGTYSQNFKRGWKMNVSADSLLIIKNNALGYTIRYNLVYFNLDFNRISFYGYPLFEDHYKSDKNHGRISGNRKEAYAGSKLHFFRSLYSHRLEEEGFEIHRIMEQQKDSDDVKDYGLLEDSVFTGKSKVILKQTEEKMDLYGYLASDSITGSKILTIYEPFEIFYLKKGEESRYGNFRNYFTGLKRTNKAQTTIAKIREGNIRFYSNGSFENSDKLVTIGYWSYKQMADLLPYNYLPAN